VQISKAPSVSPVSQRAVRLPVVMQMTGMSRATVWRRVREDSGFPKPFYPSPAIAAWDFEELLTWRDSKKAARAA